MTDTAETSDASIGDKLVSIPGGGVELEVTHMDGSKETVSVRQIQLSRFAQYALLVSWGHQAEMIELYCDKPKGWADTLTPESARAVADKGQEINLPFFKAWSRHQKKWRDAFADSTKD
jgi:hypothetical protein